MSGGVRCFVSVGLPAPVREGIGAFLAAAGPAVRGVAWAAPGRLHLTLKFLGEIAAERIPDAAAALDAAAAGREPFTVILRGAGAFPEPHRARVVWIGAGPGSGELAALAAAAEEALARAGFPREGRPFAAHLTIGRIRAPLRDPGDLLRLLAAARGREWGEVPVPAAHLVRSDLFPTGPRYSILHESRLGGIPPAAP